MTDCLKVGDLIFMEFKPKKWYWKILAKLQQYFDETRFHHVAVYIGNHRVIEMHDTGLREVILPIQKDVRLESLRVSENIDKNKFLQCVDEYIKTMKTIKYPNFELYQIAASVFTKKVFGLRLPMFFDGNNAVCSAFAVELYEDYGIYIGTVVNQSVGELYRNVKNKCVLGVDI